MAKRKGLAFSKLSTALVSTIEHVIEERGTTVKEAAETWGLPKATLQNVLKRGNFGVVLIDQILETENTDPVSFLLQNAAAAAAVEGTRGRDRTDAEAFLALMPTQRRQVWIGLLREASELGIEQTVEDLTRMLIKSHTR